MFRGTGQVTKSDRWTASRWHTELLMDTLLQGEWYVTMSPELLLSGIQRFYSALKCLHDVAWCERVKCSLIIGFLLWACSLGRSKKGLWLGHIGWCGNDNLQCTVKSAHILPFPSSPLVSLENKNVIQSLFPSLSVPLALTVSAAGSMGADLQGDRWSLDRCTLNKGL